MKSKTYDIGSWRAGDDGVTRLTASAKWGGAPALDGQRDVPLALRLSEWLGRTMQSWESHFVSNAKPRSPAR